MILKPWYTSNDIISAVKRKIALPTFQGTFSNEDILDFANEVLKEEQVPLIMQYHEEYFTTRVIIPLEANKSSYTIPERAIGTKLRDLYFQDTNGNLYEMTAINPDDRSFWAQTNYSANNVSRYYLEGNNIILVPGVTVAAPAGNLYFSIYQRPNLIVSEDRAAIITGFCKIVTIDNTSLVAGDTLTLNQNNVDTIFTAVAGAPSINEFQIGATSAITANNLANTVNTNGIGTASVVSSIVTIEFVNRKMTFATSNTAAIQIDSRLCIDCDGGVPTIFIPGVNIDIMQTKPAHKIYNTSVLLVNGSVSGNSFLIDNSLVSQELIVGDYIGLEYESIIPQIPSDMHSALAERTSGRILAAQGDTQGLQVTSAKIGEIKQAETSFLENRTEGNAKKVTSRHSVLRYSKRGYYRSGG